TWPRSATRRCRRRSSTGSATAAASPSARPSARPRPAAACTDAGRVAPPPRRHGAGRPGTARRRARGSALLRRDPAVHALFQQVEWHGAAAQHRVVEAADVEALAKGLLGLPAQLLDADHADLVG